MSVALEGYCTRGSCRECGLRDELTCRQTWREIMDFMLPAAMYFMLFIAGMWQGEHATALAVWAVLAAAFFLYGQQFLICRHCPHYAGPGRFLACHAAFGLPKIPSYDPRPLTKAETAALLLVTMLLFLYYVPLFIAAGQWLFLLLTSWALFAWVWGVQRFLCSRCVNINCPFNRLSSAKREQVALAGGRA